MEPEVEPIVERCREQGKQSAGTPGEKTEGTRRNPPREIVQQSGKGDDPMGNPHDRDNEESEPEHHENQPIRSVETTEELHLALGPGMAGAPHELISHFAVGPPVAAVKALTPRLEGRIKHRALPHWPHPSSGALPEHSGEKIVAEDC